MEMGHAALNSLLKASWQAAVLILLLLLLQRLLGRRLRPQWRYTLWSLVVIRLALPWTIPSELSLFNLGNLCFGLAHTATRARAPGTFGAENDQAFAGPGTVRTSPLAARGQPLPPRFDLTFACLAGLWSAGALGFAVCVAIHHARFSRAVARRRPLLDPAVLHLLEDCKQQMRVRVPVSLVETSQVACPALFGFLRPRLLLPAGLTRQFSPRELRYIFLHELAHLKRHDILAGWGLAALQTLHWFNPLVWLAFHRMRADRELACDAMALSCLQSEENQAYGQTIIKLLERFGRSGWTPSLAGTVENRRQLKERITMIASYQKSHRLPALALALFAGLGLVTLTDAEPGDAQLRKDLVATWVLAGSPGEVGPAPAAGGRQKSLTDTRWSVTQLDAKTGRVLFHHGGTYTLNGDEYTEHVEFANASTTNLVGKSSKFRLTLEGDTLTLIGLGNPWREVWKKLPGSGPRKADPDVLQGSWVGHEAGRESKGACSLVIKGSTLDFHGGDTNEWYKATFTVYDTTPKQVVIALTDCPFPQYVGLTAYAIYELQDGTLTIAGNEPGNPVVPATVDAPTARKFVFNAK